MLNSFNKYYIDVRQFLRSINKEIYQVTYLDFIIFQYINFIAKELKQELPRLSVKIDLDQEQQIELVQALGKALRSFLSNWCLKECSLRCPLNWSKKIDLKDKIDQTHNKKEKEIIKGLVDTFGENTIILERALRLDIREYVIWNVLFDFFGIEFNEPKEHGDLTIVPLSEQESAMFLLADIFEYDTVQFINLIDKKYLENHDHPAMQEFKNLPYENEFEDSFEEEDDSNEGKFFETFDDTTIPDVFIQFQEFLDKSYPEDEAIMIENDIQIFKEYLSEEEDIEDIFDLSEFYLSKFMGYWLIKRLVFDDENKVLDIYNALAIFINWLYTYYGLDLKKSFLDSYEKAKLSTQRAIRAINNFYKIHNLVENMILKTKFLPETQYGWVQIENIERFKNAYLDVKNVRTKERMTRIFMDSTVAIYLESGDFILATFLKRGSSWSIIELHEIIPTTWSKFFPILID